VVKYNTNMNNKTNFIFEHWEVINISIFCLAIITIIIALLQKDSLKTKIINIFIITFVPLVGCIYFFGRLLFRYRKKRLHKSTEI
jgi:hypothetical protein